MLRHLGTIVIVTFITIVVWVFAEAASVRTRELPTASITFSGDDSTFVRVLDNQNWHEVADIVIEGSTAEIDEAERVLRNIKLVPGQAGVPAEPGEHTIDLRTALRSSAGLPAKGVTIARVSPATVRIEVDKLVPTIANIRVELFDAELDGAAEVKPATARIYLPGKYAATLPDAPIVTAVVDVARVKQLVPGRREVLAGVPLRSPGAAAVYQIDPPTVEIALKLKSKQSSITLKTVPVMVRMAPRELSRFDVTLNEADQFLRDVKISGPSDLLDQLARDEFKVVATLSLTYEDLERSITSKEATFADMPSNLSFDAPNRLIRMTVRKR